MKGIEKGDKVHVLCEVKLEPTFRTLAKYFPPFFIGFSITTNILHDFMPSQDI